MLDPRDLAAVLPQLADAPEALAALARKARVVTLAPGDPLLREGEQRAVLLALLAGEVEVLRPLGSGQRAVAGFGAPALLGESALFPGGRRTATVRARTAVRVAELPAATFRKVLLEHPEVALELLARWMERLERREAEYHEVLRHQIVARDRELAELRLERAEHAQPEGVWCPSLEPVLDRARRLAASDLPVLILGESGTGKEHVARFVHRQSARADRPLSTLNCAAIPAEIAEAELFGVVRGAFTGATRDREGLLRTADGGTVFLDEVGDLPATVQGKLLRALQDGTFFPVGSDRPERTDVRLVSATNKDLAAEVKAGRFREDLLYRLAGARVVLPPLRERRDHIPILARWVVGQSVRDVEPSLVLEHVLPVLVRYGWPGNVRELISALRSALALAQTFPRLQVTDLPEELQATFAARREAALPAAREPLATSVAARLQGRSLPEHLRETSRELIRAALAESGGVQRAAAALLGLTPQNLSNYLRRGRS
jgi:transcriptional regulator with GAF, ATPase, and Fis domain